MKSGGHRFDAEKEGGEAGRVIAHHTNRVPAPALPHVFAVLHFLVGRPDAHVIWKLDAGVAFRDLRARSRQVSSSALASGSLDVLAVPCRAHEICGTEPTRANTNQDNEQNANTTPSKASHTTRRPLAIWLRHQALVQSIDIDCVHVRRRAIESWTWSDRVALRLSNTLSIIIRDLRTAPNAPSGLRGKKAEKKKEKKPVSRMT